MAKLTQRESGMWETPQITPKQLSTPVHGGMSPDHIDVMRSANARSTQRHEMKQQGLADLEVLPDSAEIMGNEMVGIRDSGYLTKKNLQFGVNAFYNSLPPGMDIEDQENADIREEELFIYEGGLSYMGDGWNKRPRGSHMPKKFDSGRNAETNYMGTKGLNPRNPR